MKYLEQSTSETRDKSLERFINSRKDIEIRKANKEGRQVNLGCLSLETIKQYEQDPISFRHGKTVIGPLKALLQRHIGGNIDLFRVSSFIKDVTLEQIALEIWNGKMK